MVAELGKARYIPVEKVEAGMKVHRDVMGRRGTPLIMAGEVLTHKHVEKLRKWEAREKPIGKALPKKDHRNTYERVQHAEFQGGYKISHFNQKGILVSSTLASGSETPEVERNVEKSEFFQGTKRKSYSIGAGKESPLFRIRDLEAEIKTLKSVNSNLGGVVHQNPCEDDEDSLISFRDLIVQENNSLIEQMKTKQVDQKDPSSPTNGKRKTKKSG